MAARKKAGARCRTIGGVVYDLTATDRKAPCGRRASSSPSKPPPSKPPAAPAIKSLMLTVEQGPVGGYDLIASSREGGGVAEVIGHFGSRGEASAAKVDVQKTGELPKPAPQPFRKRDVRVTDLRVLERQEQERAHKAREQREAFDRAKAPKSTLAAAGRLPKRAFNGPGLRTSERSVLEAVGKRNAAGLFYHADAFKPATLAILEKLASQGLVKAHGHGAFYLPQNERDLSRFTRNKVAAPKPPTVDAPPAVRLSGYEKRRMKKTPLPKSIDPSSARVGDQVSVFTYGSSEPEHAILKSLPGEPLMYGAVSREPAVLFSTGANSGMNRSISWDRMFAGWLDPNVNWEPWRR
jgi:hypothetical protein